MALGFDCESAMMERHQTPTGFRAGFARDGGRSTSTDLVRIAVRPTGPNELPKRAGRFTRFAEVEPVGNGGFESSGT